MTFVNAIILAAMPEELAPALQMLDSYQLTTRTLSTGEVTCAVKGRTSLVLAESGIGMVAAASTLTCLLNKYNPQVVVYIGSAGGLATQIKVRDVVIGTEYINAGADRTAFGYPLGQVPGYEISAFPADPILLETAHATAAAFAGEVNIQIGPMLSSDAFVTAENVEKIRAHFPDALSADMESQAAAQVAKKWDVPFFAVRGISDLCGPPADQAAEFSAQLSEVATSAATVALEVLRRASALDAARVTRGPAQQFSEDSLRAALYLTLAAKNDAEPAAHADLPAAIRQDVLTHIADLPAKYADWALGMIAAGQQLSAQNPRLSLAAKDYDAYRAKFVVNYPELKSGAVLWPPTSQTVIKRFNGYWNDALEAIGLRARRGRARGGLKFTNADYLKALRMYADSSRAQEYKPSFNGYTRWLKDSGNYGKLPSGAAIRQRFGSWKNALKAAALNPEEV
ncbi:MAG: 5'-methylthioadenosine/S-adenosylhomocysteine nucleosidase [Trueperella sp.]|nr:5'-methylthioadenosine/S-adenosylhomocysteine nucleosidase [Trueperella sp.]